MLTLDEQYVRLFVLVHIRIGMCCCLVMMVAIAQLCAIYVYVYATTLQWRRLSYDCEWILIAVEYTTHCYVDFGRTVCTFISGCSVPWLR